MSADPRPRKRSLARWVTGTAIGLALIVVAMAGAAWWLIESLDLKQIIARVEGAAEEITGRAVTLGAEPQLSFTPLLKLVVRDVTLGNMKGAARSEMLKVARLEIGISLTPLLSGRRPGLNIALIDPDLLLEVNERGERNWALKLSPEEALARLKKAVALLDGKISLESVRIESAAVRFDDRREGRKMTLTARRAVLELKNGGDYDLELDAALNGVPVAVRAGFRMPGPGTLVPARVKASLPGVTLSAEGVVRPAWPTPGTDVKVALEIGDVSQLADALGVKLGKLPSGKLDTQLQGTDQGMRASPLHLALGRSTLNGSIEVTRFEPRPQIRASLDAPVFDFAELLAAADMAGATPRAEPADVRIFPATRLPLSKLQALDAESQLKVGRLMLPGPRTLEGLQARVSLASGRLSIEPFSLATGSGRVSGRLRLDASSARTATVEAELQSKDVGLGNLLTLAGVRGGEIKEAPTNMAIRLTAGGDSVRAWMSALNGQVRIVVGAGHLPGKLANWSSSVIGQALEVANPYRSSDDGSALKCAVVNVPVRSGVILIKDTIAAETDKVVGAVSGTVDLGQERLNLILHSQSAGGLGPGLADFASAAKVIGTLTKPELAVNVQGAAVAGLRVGAAIATLGITELAGSLAHKAMPSHPCEAALGAKAETKSENAQPSGEPGATEKKPGFFGRMLGK